jgi:hypothetical protein
MAVSIAVQAAEPSTEAWEYLSVKDSKDLQKVTGDPTNKCERATTLTVLGHMGWELTQVLFDTSVEMGASKGAIALGPPSSQGQRGTFEIRSENRSAAVFVIFKRRTPHVAQSLKPCPS